MGLLRCSSQGAAMCCEPVRVGCGAQDRETITPEKPVKLRVFTFQDLETATDGFSKEALLGKSSYGSLYKGTLKDGRLVAVKKQEFLEDEDAFDNELEILSTLHSDRFVNLVGFSKDSEIHEKLLVVDFMPNGNLHDVLHYCPEPLGWNMRAHLALQIAKSINALHSASPPVIHRDIKSANILIDGRWNAKLGDFGLALRGHIEDVLKHPAPPAGTIGYIDPSYETPRRLSTKSDVFSFGVLLLELMSGREAVDTRYKPPHIIDWALPLIKQGKIHALFDPKLPVPPHDAKPLKTMIELVTRCLRRTTHKRPPMAYVVAELKGICARIPLPEWIGLARVMKMGHMQGPEMAASREFSHVKNSNKCNIVSADRESSNYNAHSARLGNKDSIFEQLPPAKDHFTSRDLYGDLGNVTEASRDYLVSTSREYSLTGSRDYPPFKDFPRACEGHSRSNSQDSFRISRGDTKDIAREHSRGEQSRSRPGSRGQSREQSRPVSREHSRPASREHSRPASREPSKEWYRDHSRLDHQERSTDLPREFTRDVLEASLNHIRKWRSSKDSRTSHDKCPGEDSSLISVAMID